MAHIHQHALLQKLCLHALCIWAVGCNHHPLPARLQACALQGSLECLRLFQCLKVEVAFGYDAKPATSDGAPPKLTHPRAPVTLRTGSSFPITPVLARTTPFAGTPNTFEAHEATCLQAFLPTLPVHAFATPEFATTSCATPETLDLLYSIGGAANLFSV